MQPNATNILTELKSFLNDAGALGLSIQQTAERSEKEDSTIVTEADLAISNLFQQRFNHYLSQPGHMLVDEEVAKSPRDEVLAADYQWVIDPIDGTASYAGNSLFWGIIVSVFRKGQPWLGAVYLPAMGLLYWADETDVYETTTPFTAQENTRTLQAIAMPFSRSSQIAVHAEFLPSLFAQVPFIPVDYWSPLNGAFVAAGRLRGTIAWDALWDFGANFVFATRLGYTFRRLSDGKVFTHLNADLLTPEWKVASYMFLGPDEVYQQLKPHLSPRLTSVAA